MNVCLTGDKPHNKVSISRLISIEDNRALIMFLLDKITVKLSCRVTGPFALALVEYNEAVLLSLSLSLSLESIQSVR
ncbi:hypothetical protein M513_00654 [Trichuris suis]|uniref:Uncharacterized protein n=1 Tax=Trichuris suis TaxID=68888 RepID=A0A085MMI2_9BILA|nr:hypothetical protein M513_00654 [Trichuris suis]